jgi:hypothetical protein
VELEFHQLELRYERLKVIRPEPERRLLASLVEVGQQVPIVVVKGVGEGPIVVIDGYKRVGALRRLGRDTVGASCWPGGRSRGLDRYPADVDRRAGDSTRTELVAG